MKKVISILGIRGIPAAHGGFETFAENLALYLIERGWDVTVYCQISGEGAISYSSWNGVRLVNIPIGREGTYGTVLFDWKATWHSRHSDGLILTLGYNTAVFSIVNRVFRQPCLMNMDGIEWKREKWGALARLWLYLNERAGIYLSHHLIADHPRIEAHLRTRSRRRRISMIPYGAESIDTADSQRLSHFGLEGSKYAIVIARPEPENSILEIVTAFSDKHRDCKLVVLGNFEYANPAYREEVFRCASDEVIFPGAIYDKKVVQALRFHATVYIHGHTVGGTNPSLVEALGSGSAVLAHDNEYNRWVAGAGARYFTNIEQLSRILDKVFIDEGMRLRMAGSSRSQFRDRFTWDMVLSQYEALLLKWANG